MKICKSRIKLTVKQWKSRKDEVMEDNIFVFISSSVFNKTSRQSFIFWQKKKILNGFCVDFEIQV